MAAAVEALEPTKSDEPAEHDVHVASREVPTVLEVKNGLSGCARLTLSRAAR